MKIAIIYTTFLRDELAKNTIKSIYDNWNPNYSLLIGNQNNLNSLNKFGIDLPFDCGLSYARNYLVQEANKLGCKYCLVTADSIEFKKKYDFGPIIEFMENKGASKVGFKLNNRISWEFDIELISGYYFELKNPSTPPINYKGIEYQKVDICKNFFLATTDSLLKVPWDKNLKLCEHEDAAWRYKQAGYKTYFTEYISADYIDYKPKEYKKYRDRMYGEYRKLFLQKYNIKNWVKKSF